MENEPTKIKVSLILKVGFMIVLVIFSFFMWRMGRIYGGREACRNSEGQLGEEFSCEFPQAQEDIGDFMKLGQENIVNAQCK